MNDFVIGPAPETTSSAQATPRDPSGLCELVRRILADALAKNVAPIESERDLAARVFQAANDLRSVHGLEVVAELRAHRHAGVQRANNPRVDIALVDPSSHGPVVAIELKLKSTKNAVIEGMREDFDKLRTAGFDETRNGINATSTAKPLLVVAGLWPKRGSARELLVHCAEHGGYWHQPKPLAATYNEAAITASSGVAVSQQAIVDAWHTALLAPSRAVFDERHGRIWKGGVWQAREAQVQIALGQALVGCGVVVQYEFSLAALTGSARHSADLRLQWPSNTTMVELKIHEDPADDCLKTPLTPQMQSDYIAALAQPFVLPPVPRRNGKAILSGGRLPKLEEKIWDCRADVHRCVHAINQRFATQALVLFEDMALVDPQRITSMGWKGVTLGTPLAQIVALNGHLLQRLRACYLQRRALLLNAVTAGISIPSGLTVHYVATLRLPLPTNGQVLRLV